MTDRLPPAERIAVLRKRIDKLNHNSAMDIDERLEEIAKARDGIKRAEKELSRGN